MKKLNLNQMENVQGGGCVGAMIGSLAVTASAISISYATGGLATALLGGWILSKMAATANLLEDCAGLKIL